MAGDVLSLTDGQGKIFEGRILESSPTEITGILLTETILPKSAVRMHLFQAMLKSPKMDWVVEKATELGASAITPLLCERNVVRLKTSSPIRWRRIIEAAAKQCGAAHLPRLEETSPLSQALSGSPKSLTLFFWEEEKRLSLHEALKAHLKNGPSAIRIFIGPEGGFTKEEARLAKEKGAQVVSLGQRTLRAETAAMAALAIVGCEVSV